MDLWSSLHVIARRWYVVVPALALTGIVAALVAANTQVTYTARGSSVLLAPSEANTTNPYTNFNPSLQTTAQVVGNDVASQATRTTFAVNKLDSSYRIIVPYDATRSVLLPEIDYTVEAPNAKTALATVDALHTTVSKTLADRQEASGAPRSSWIQSVAGSRSSRAEQNNGSQIRAVAIVGLLGLAISFSLAFAAEGLAAHRARRRSVEVLNIDLAETNGHDMHREPVASGPNWR